MQNMPIAIFRGDDTDALGYQTIVGTIRTDLNLTGCRAVFKYLSFSAEFDPIPEDKKLTVIIPASETKKFPPGLGYASLRVYDAEGKLCTFSNRIMVFVATKTPMFGNAEFEVDFNVRPELEPLKIFVGPNPDDFDEYRGFLEKVIDRAGAEKYGLAMLLDAIDSDLGADDGVAATPVAVKAAYAAIIKKLTDDYYTKDETDEAIDRVAAYYITYDTAGNPFPTHASLVNATTVYSGGKVRTPTRNDYAIVLADETHDNAEYRYIYAVAEGQTTGSWRPQYPVEGVMTVDPTVTRNSQNPVSGGGIWSAIWGALSALPTGFSSLYDWCANQLAGKASKADATLAERGFTEWVCNPAKVLHGDPSHPTEIEVAVYKPNDKDVWALSDLRNAAAHSTTYMASRPYDPTATTLTFTINNSGFQTGTVTATRTALPGYQLGSQSDKPLASEAEAEALRSGKADETTPVVPPLSLPADCLPVTGTYNGSDFRLSTVQIGDGGTEYYAQGTDAGGNTLYLALFDKTTGKYKSSEFGIDALKFNGRAPTVNSWPVLNLLTTGGTVVRSAEFADALGKKVDIANAEVDHKLLVYGDVDDYHKGYPVEIIADYKDGVVTPTIVSDDGYTSKRYTLPVPDWQNGQIVLNGNLALLQNIAGDFKASATYAKDALVVYEGALYRCVNAAGHTGPWLDADFSRATAEDVLAAIRAALAGKLDKSGGTMTGELKIRDSVGFEWRFGASVSSAPCIEVYQGGILFGRYYPSEGTGNLALKESIGLVAYVSGESYMSDSLVVKDGGVYRCTASPASTGSWVASEWEKLFDLDTGAPASGGTKLITNGQVFTALQGKADVSAIPYTLGTTTVIDEASSEVVEGETVNYGAATLANRTENIVQVTAATALDELRITFPAATLGKVRDFGLRVEIGTGSAALAAPALVPVAPAGETIKIENADGTIPALADGTATAKGVTLLYFSENAPGIFVVKGEQVEEVA